MTLKECKDQIASENGFDLDRSRDSDTFNSSEYYAECVAKLYACEKVKEALKLAAERAKVKGIPMDEGGYLKMIDVESILSLETEIVNQINK